MEFVQFVAKRMFALALPQGVHAPGCSEPWCLADSALPFPVSSFEKPMNRTGEQNSFYSPEVEMAGVEPASRRFEREHTTSLVDHLDLAQAAADQQATA